MDQSLIVAEQGLQFFESSEEGMPVEDYLTQWWHEIIARPNGPMAIRFYLQPLMATIFAVRDGIRDARADRPAYLWAIVTDRAHRRELLRSGWHSIGKIFLLAFLLDLIYQLVVLNGLRPIQTILIACALAIGPYLLLRGPIGCLVRALKRNPQRSDAGAPRPT